MGARINAVLIGPDNGYDCLITMDCDFTHAPSYILNFIRGEDKADIVVGSRYMKNTVYQLEFISEISYSSWSFLTVSLLNMPYDASGAFRLYNLRQINRNIFLIKSNGYSFF